MGETHSNVWGAKHGREIAALVWLWLQRNGDEWTEAEGLTLRLGPLQCEGANVFAPHSRPDAARRVSDNGRQMITRSSNILANSRFALARRPESW
jgi:hypothetical protein